MTALGVRPDAANIVDFGPEALSRIEKARQQETSVRRRLERLARANFDAQAQTHEAVIELLGARNNSDLAFRLDHLAKARFGLVAAVLALEDPERAPAGWRPLAPGQCDLALGEGQAARLGKLPTALGLFGEEAEAVRSVALIRLLVWGREGMLAFGAPDERTFAPDMGHELIDFLARVIERTAERWPIA
jgi:uncharacterized protein YigA (DUF484 family)